MKEGVAIGIGLFDGAEELDWVGPWEVLSSWSKNHPEDGVEVFTVARDSSRPIECAKGLRVLADHSWGSTPEIDVLVYPGGIGARGQLADEAVRAWIRSIHKRARLTTSVCTGALVLADAGLLKGRPATTHWSAFDELLAIDGTIEARPHDRFVDDGDIITAAGISAGIDMSLHLIVRLHSEDRARDTKRGFNTSPSRPCSGGSPGGCAVWRRLASRGGRVPRVDA